MMDGMQDEKSLKLNSLMDLIKELKGMEGADLPGKPKAMAIDIHAEKLPGSEDAAHEDSESPEFERGEEEGMEMPEDGSEEADIESKLPPELLALLKEHLKKKM